MAPKRQRPGLVLVPDASRASSGRCLRLALGHRGPASTSSATLAFPELANGMTYAGMAWRRHLVLAWLSFLSIQLLHLTLADLALLYCAPENGINQWKKIFQTAYRKRIINIKE